jgi:hypothetical protein
VTLRALAGDSASSANPWLRKMLGDAALVDWLMRTWLGGLISIDCMPPSVIRLA